MVLKVWRGKTTLHVECTACGCYGTGHFEVRSRLDPKIQEALDNHEAHMMALRDHFTSAVNNIVRQIKAGSLERQTGAKQISELQKNFTGQIILAHNNLPNPDGKVTEFITNCPWCNVAEAVDVEQLPDDVTEPPFEQAKAVRTYQDKQVAAAKKGK